MNDKRYYYKDPLAAAWMNDKFDMCFVDKDGNSLSVYEGSYFISSTGVGGYTDSPDEAYVAPDSLKILEPQEMDLVYANVAIKGIMSFAPMFEYMEWHQRTFQKYESVHLIRVVERNGVAFMVPEVEYAI